MTVRCHNDSRSFLQMVNDYLIETALCSLNLIRRAIRFNREERVRNMITMSRCQTVSQAKFAELKGIDIPIISSC